MMLEMNVNKVCAFQAPKSLGCGVFQSDLASNKMANGSICQRTPISGPSTSFLRLVFEQSTGLISSQVCLFQKEFPETRRTY